MISFNGLVIIINIAVNFFSDQLSLKQSAKAQPRSDGQVEQFHYPRVVVSKRSLDQKIIISNYNIIAERIAITGRFVVGWWLAMQLTRRH